MQGRVIVACCLAAAISFARCQALDAASTPEVQGLLQLQQKSKDGVINLDSNSFSTYVTGKERPFSLFVFLRASHLPDKTGMALAEMREDFGYAAKALKEKVAKGEFENPGSLFFADADYKQSPELFQRLGVQQLPCAFILTPSTPVNRERIRVRADDMMKPETFEKFPWTSEEFSSFLTDRTGISLGKIVRPSILTSPLFPFLAIAFLVGGGVTAYKLYYAPFMKNLLIWTAGTLLVYWFSVSGGMHNIIRGMPLYALTQNGAMFFMPPGQGQLGAEGFLLGTGYLMVGLSVTGITYMHKFSGKLEEKKRRWLAYGIMATGAYSFMRVVALYRWKTGQTWRTYF